MASKMHLECVTMLQCNFSGCDNIPLHIGQGNKPMTEMTCVGANAGSFYHTCMTFDSYMMWQNTKRDFPRFF